MIEISGVGFGFFYLFIMHMEWRSWSGLSPRRWQMSRKEAGKVLNVCRGPIKRGGARGSSVQIPGPQQSLQLLILAIKSPQDKAFCARIFGLQPDPTATCELIWGKTLVWDPYYTILCCFLFLFSACSPSLTVMHTSKIPQMVHAFMSSVLKFGLKFPQCPLCFSATDALKC